jgi:hypothetical protein
MSMHWFTMTVKVTVAKAWISEQKGELDKAQRWPTMLHIPLVRTYDSPASTITFQCRKLLVAFSDDVHACTPGEVELWVAVFSG